MSWQPSWPLKSTSNWKLSNTQSRVKIHLIIFHQLLLVFCFLGNEIPWHFNRDEQSQLCAGIISGKSFLLSRQKTLFASIHIHFPSVSAPHPLDLLTYIFSIKSNSSDLIHDALFLYFNDLLVQIQNHKTQMSERAEFSSQVIRRNTYIK